MIKNSQNIWFKVVYETGFWLAAEICLNIVGLDNIADYCEFMSAQETDLNIKNLRIIALSEHLPKFCPKIENFCPLPATLTKPTEEVEHSCTALGEIFNNKCQQLAQPCLKVMYLSTKKELDRYIDIENC